MTPAIPGGFLFYTKYAVENKVHYLGFRVQTVPGKIFGNRRVTVLREWVPARDKGGCSPFGWTR